MTMTQMSAAQLARQHSRTAGGQYAEKLRSEAELDLAVLVSVTGERFAYRRSAHDQMIFVG